VRGCGGLAMRTEEGEEGEGEGLGRRLPTAGSASRRPTSRSTSSSPLATKRTWVRGEEGATKRAWAWGEGGEGI
jgi:hypothetical protein